MTRSLVKIIALCGVAALAFATTAQAQVTKEDAKCRATANKSAGKYASTANKAVIGCIKDTIKGKASETSCANPVDADAKGKLGKARDKLTSSVGGAKDKCGGLPISYVTCPSPGQAGMIVTTAISSKASPPPLDLKSGRPAGRGVFPTNEADSVSISTRVSSDTSRTTR